MFFIKQISLSFYPDSAIIVRMENSSRLTSIQMIGTQRSGSNLLRVMLNELPELYAPHPPHVIQIFAPLVKYYGNLEVEGNFKKLIEHVCTLIELNPVSWEIEPLNRQLIYERCRHRSLLEIFIQINEVVCIAKSKTAWCCKSLETVYYVEHFEEENFHPYVVYLFRDGRDVATSFKKVMVGEKHIYHLAKKWKQEQEIALRYIQSLPANKYISLRYEDFIQQPEQYIRQICQQAGLKYDEAVMNYYTSSESKRTAESGKMWENVVKPIAKDNTRKFLKELSPYEVELFEFVAGDMLDQLGYKRTVSSYSFDKLTEEQLRLFDKENEVLKQTALEKADQNDKLKRKPQADFLKKIKADFGII